MLSLSAALKLTWFFSCFAPFGNGFNVILREYTPDGFSFQAGMIKNIDNNVNLITFLIKQFYN